MTSSSKVPAKAIRTFIVGGAVRDELLGKEPKDRDYLIIGATREELIDRGFVPIGKGYPVFLHPDNRQEYVLAESLEEDLLRRDLTINAMAISEADGKLIDPYQGKEDLERKILRHVSAAFADDPLRVYRAARFKSTFPEFSIAPETLELMRGIASSGRLEELVSERILGELKRVLQGEKPSLFFLVLQEVGAIASFFPELEDLKAPQLEDLDRASASYHDPILNFAILCRSLSLKAVRDLSTRLKVPNQWLDAALMAAGHYQQLKDALHADAEALLELLYQMDSFRKPGHVELLSRIDESLVQEGELLKSAFAIVRAVKAQGLPSGVSGREVGDLLRLERLRLLQHKLSNPNP